MKKIENVVTWQFDHNLISENICEGTVGGKLHFSLQSARQSFVKRSLIAFCISYASRVSLNGLQLLQKPSLCTNLLLIIWEMKNYFQKLFILLALDGKNKLEIELVPENLQGLGPSAFITVHVCQLFMKLLLMYFRMLFISPKNGFHSVYKLQSNSLLIKALNCVIFH